MIFKILLSSFLFFVFAGWGFGILWHNSACERAAAAAAPVDWLVRATMLVLEPLTGYESERARSSALEYEGVARDFVARWVYNREGGYRQLCESDPIHLMRRAQLLDHRGLLKKDSFANGFTLTVPPATAAQRVVVVTSQVKPVPAPPLQEQQPLPSDVLHKTGPQIADTSVPSPQKAWSYDKIILLGLVVLVVAWWLLKFMAANNKYRQIVEWISSPIKDLRILLVHVLPRSAIVPQSGREPTDKTN